MISVKGKRTSKGFTLIELMIAILIGFLVVGAVLTIYITTVRGSSNTLKLTRLNQDLGVAMLIMTNDIRRAGYWGGAIVGANLTLNPFSTVEVRNVGAGALDPPPSVGNCITYAYDANAWANPATYDPDVDSATPDANEYFGFRLSGGAVQIRTSGDTLIDPSCNDADDVWVNLTDPEEVVVTTLQFDLIADNSATNATGSTVTARQVEITLQGESESDDDITASLSDIVKIRNNLVAP